MVTRAAAFGEGPDDHLRERVCRFTDTDVVTTARTYTHVVADERELQYETLLA
jgi:hypothetical protein